MLVTLEGQGLKLRNCLNVEPGNKLWSLTTERNNVCHYFLHSKNFVHLLIIFKNSFSPYKHLK